jgi:hypothetical protein
MTSSGVAHQRAANCQHLLLAARQQTGGGIGTRGEVWKHPQHVLEAPFPRTPGILDAKDQVLPHRQGRKDIPVFGNVTKAQMRDSIARQSGNIMALEPYRALRRHLSHDGFDRRGAPDAVASQQADNLTSVDIDIDALQYMALAIVGMQILDLQHHAASSPR